MRRLTIALSCAIAVSLLWPLHANALPDEISQVGFVVDNEGMPFEGEHDIRVRFYDRREGGERLFEEWHRDVPFIDGNYAIAIGSIEDLNPLDFLRPALFVGITIDNNPESTPRLPIMKIPIAMLADVALDVRGEINPEAIRINGNVIVDANGQWVGDPTGLVGPAGPPGADGARGPQGERGARVTG